MEENDLKELQWQTEAVTVMPRAEYELYFSGADWIKLIWTWVNTYVVVID